jgi:antitoxin PrlF
MHVQKQCIMKSKQILKSTVTERGQTTIPAGVRKALRLKAHQRLTYEICDDSVVVRAETENIMDLAGSLKSSVPTTSKSEERAQARKARLGRYQ